MQNLSSEYRYASADPTWANAYLWPKLLALLQADPRPRGRLFEVGCGGGGNSRDAGSGGLCSHSDRPLGVGH